MVLNLINRSYLLIGMILFILFSASQVTNTDSIVFHIVSFVTFLVYGIVLYHSNMQNNSFFKKRNLAIIVLFISILEVAFLQLLSYYIDGDTFVFSKTDSLLYYNVGLKMSTMSLSDGILYLKNSLGYGVDDWGAFILPGIIFKIFPSQQLLSIIHCIVGTVSALMIFSIGRHFMPRRYAFMAALSFSLASFSLVLHATCLKETVMICLIISAFHCFMIYIRTKNVWFLVFTISCSLSILFFRTPVALLLIFTFGLTWVLLNLKGPAAIVLAVVFILGIFSTSLFSSTYDRYLRGGDTELIMERKNELAGTGGLVNQLADPIAAIAGPFPSIQIKTIKVTPLYASGLLFRFLLCAPFFLGTYFIIKNRYVKMYPFVIFFLTNAIGVAISVKGLETRLSLPHLAMMYIVAFWFLAKYDYEQFHWKLSPKIVYGYFMGIFGLCMLWNLR